MDERRFEEELRSKLDGYGLDLPEGDWEAIESRMGRRVPRAVWMRRVRRVRRIAVAACVAALVAGVWFLPSVPSGDVTPDSAAEPESVITAESERVTVPETESETEECAEAVREEVDAAGAATEEPHAMIASAEGAVRRTAAHAEDKSVRVIRIPEESAKADETAAMEEITTAAAIRGDEEVKGENGKRMTPEEAEQLMRERDREIERMVNAQGETARAARHNAERGVSIGLLAAVNPTSPVQGDNQINQVILNGYLSAVPESPNIGEKRETHYLPVSIGLDVSFEVYKNLDIRTGLTYTGLYSTFATEFNSGDERTRNQQLHYLGIPLSLAYRFWSGKVLNTYASVGGMCEKGLANVSIDSYYDAGEGRTTDERRRSEGIEGLQWSLTANIGLGVRLYKGLMFYVEPGFTWYIPNGQYPQPTSLRTKSPYNFSIKTGLRFHI